MIPMKARLAVMMFLQFFIWGAWYVTLGTWLSKALHFSDQQIGWAYGTTAIGAIVSPFFVGLVADRAFATQRLLGVLHLLGAALLLVASSQSAFVTLYGAVQLYALCYMPTLALTASLAMRQMTDTKQEFGMIRVFGTIGWIIAGLLIGAWGVEATATPMHLAAGASALMGVLYALFQNDLKRVLAYSTIENIGFIFVGLGLALAFKADGFETAAILALTAALFHAFNHSIFKSLLFFGSGAVLTATGERNMDKLGGLIHRMPVTAFAVLVGCAAISALPPLNGFASEWLTFQAILLSPELPQWGLKLVVPAVGALLALSVALAAACFVRVFGIAFLGRPRSAAAAEARETDRFSLGVMLALAAACLLAGILPGFVIDAMAPAVQCVLGGHMPQQSSVAWLSLVPISKVRSSYNGLLVFVFIAASASIAAYVIHLLASKAVRRAPIWGCGFADASPLTQYSASSFSQPIRRVFGTLLFRASEHVEMPPPGDMRPATFTVHLRDVVWDYLYAPLEEGIRVVTDRLNVLQFLTIRRYLSLVFAALVVLLLVVAIWR